MREETSRRLYNFALLAGCSWLVGWHDWSPLWFLFAMLCAAYDPTKDDQ